MLNPEFKHAVIMAFSEFCMGIDKLDPTAAHQIKGAKDFIDRLLNLGDEAKPFKTTDSGGLKAITI